MIWFLRDPLRFAEEKRAVEALQATSPWLTIMSWCLMPGGDIVVEFDVDVRGAVFDGQMLYPVSFPTVPPSVRPRIEKRWSRLHQYGVGGELCLEHGPDNWTTANTGAEMIASTYRLLMGEVHEAETAEPVPTRHNLTLGQSLRFDARRFISTSALEQRLAGLTGELSATFSIRYRAGGWLVVLVTLDVDDEWLDGSIPQAIADAGISVRGYVVEVLGRPPGMTGGAAAFRTAVLGGPADADVDNEVVLCRSPDGELRAFYLLNQSDAAVEITVVPAETRIRLDAGHQELAGRSVALIGCGSLGSKVAASLVRSGVGRFVLFDDDVLRPGNLVRHELDWTSVGRHKSDALADRLKLINPAVVAETRLHQLGGQESNGSLDGAIAKAAGCDLIIDATASGRAFNYSAAAAAEGGRAMLWVEVFGGGFGGLVARSRPGLEPDPQICRASIELWCRDKGAEPPRAGTGYDGTLGDVTMIADDAAVTAMASHAAGLALDTLLKRDPSRFPQSAYMIGMAGEWIFGQPFEAYPIDLGEPIPDAVSRLDDPGMPAALAAIAALVGK